MDQLSSYDLTIINNYYSQNHDIKLIIWGKSLYGISYEFYSATLKIQREEVLAASASSSEAWKTCSSAINGNIQQTRWVSNCEVKLDK